MTRNNPAGTHDYVYPGLIEQKESGSVTKANNEASGEIANPIVRDIIPQIDFDEGADMADGHDYRDFDLSPEADADGEVEVVVIDSDTGNAERRVNVFYGFEIIEGGDMVNAVHFTASDGQTFERAQVMGLDETGDTEVDRQKVLRSPIAFGPQENGAIALDVSDYTASSDTIKLKLLGATAEKTGRRVGTRS